MLQDYFTNITDKRQAGKIKHNLLEIVVMTICAVVAGCDAWEDIADYCRVKQTWLRESLHMKLENGIPSHDTIQRVWSMILPQEFERCFRSWVSSICQKQEQEIISIDGKTLRGSKSREKSPIHMVSAWANHNQLVLGQLATDEKSNEITAVPELLEVLDVQGCIITADAMSCQKAIARKITEQQADYVLGLKANQPTLRQDSAEYFEDAIHHPQDYPILQKRTTQDKGHGRTEKRTYYLTTDLDWLDGKQDWSALAGLGMVHTRVEVNEQVMEEKRYYITSLTDLNTFSNAVRAHWGIENSTHWCLDMTFREDYSRMRKNHSAENMAVVRHIALDILKQYPEKISLARKRRRCSYDDVFLANVLHSVHA